MSEFASEEEVEDYLRTSRKRTIREEFSQFIEFYVTSATMPTVSWYRHVNGVMDTANVRFWLTVTAMEEKDTFKVSLEIWDPKADTDSGELNFLIKNETREKTEKVFLSIKDYDPDNCVE